jgi:hypothetical protein
MPKVKAGASGRRRARQEQRGELKRAGGADSREGTGVWSGLPARREAGGAGGRGFLVCSRDGLKTVVCPRLQGADRWPQWRTNLPTTIRFLLWDGVDRSWEMKLFLVFFQDSCSTRGLGSTF